MPRNARAALFLMRLRRKEHAVGLFSGDFDPLADRNSISDPKKNFGGKVTGGLLARFYV